MKDTKKNLDLPNFVKEQSKIIDSLQKRVNELNNDFEIEKDCKNRVYFFILEKGYFDEYVAYDRDKQRQI
ncbi:hypothetical protein [Flavobacterium branchiophilum]|uniref:Uncharacterized protein n=1 Tax=Flavobacterium branchiophilum TaxID=55197 RepID=A0A2H3KAP5_9FLAO|nr:hypothetical protein [Flavobacterium branchiophilum]PDS23804.1 hypothetical protein B0A77_09890 [Flavobacterium branchiophilum]